MQEKKRPGKNKPLPELRTSVTEILVVNGRSFQPFIRTFSSTGENISRANLGTLVGVFEIDDHSEDSAYIVNFLASVAKKEYFNNPRRGAVESFEAALHKINLALAELVKHGNITWLGKLHGALGVLEKNSFHFSVTGHAKILLLRNETIADIGEGLASEESHIHPIKTFVEVSSGRLALGDQLLLGSPEILALFSLEELTKHAARMDRARFTQFLKTALVNELDMSGLMVVDVSEKTLPETALTETKKDPEQAPLHTKNVFSQSAFSSKKPVAEPVENVLIPEQQEKEADYIDTKTGHIYVQGDTPEVPSRHLFLEEAWLTVKEGAHSLIVSEGKWLRKTGKQSSLVLGALNEKRQALNKKVARAIRRQWRQYQERRAEAAARAALAISEQPVVPAPPVAPPVITVSDIPLPKKEVVLSPEISENEPLENIMLPDEAPSVPIDESTENDEMPQFLKEKLALFYKKNQTLPEAPISRETAPHQTFHERFPAIKKTTAFCTAQIQQIIFRLQAIPRFFQSLSLGTRLKRWFIHVVLPFCHTSWAFLKSLPLRQKYIVLGGGILLFIAIGFFFLRPAPAPTPDTANTEPETPSETSATSDTNARQGAPTALIENVGNIVTSVILNDEVYVITEKSIVTVAGNTSYSIPNGDSATFATAMDDLRLIFIFTKNGRLYAWSPLNKSFVENTLALPENARLTGIGTYLTYLYVLDSATDQIYRFPRAPGGFGAATSWFKESVSVEDSAHLAVSETIFVSPNTSSITGFFRGRATSTLEVPTSGLAVTDLYTSPDLTQVYALDSEHRSIFVWNQEGKLMKEYTDEKLSEGTSLSVNEKQNKIFISTENSLLSLPLQ